MTKKMVFRKSIFTFLAILANSLYAQLEPVHTTLTMENGLPSNEVYCIIQGPQDNIWMGTDRGLVKYNGNEIVTYTTEDGLPGNSILRSYMDYKGRLWFSTYRNGVFYIEDDEIVVPKFNNEIRRRSQLFLKRFILDFYVDSTDYLFMTYNKNIGGFLGANINDSVPTYYKIDEQDSNSSFLFLINKPQVGFISGIYSNKFNYGISIWKNYLNTRNVEDSIIKQRVNYNNNISFVSYLLKEKHEFWIGLNSNLSNHLNENSTISFNKKINSISRFKNDLVVGTYDGVYHLNLNQPSKIIHHRLSNIIVSNVIRDNEGFYWISTVGSGVLLIPSLKLIENKIQGDFNNLAYEGQFYIYQDTLQLLYKNSLFLFEAKKKSHSSRDYHFNFLKKGRSIKKWVSRDNIHFSQQSIKGLNNNLISINFSKSNSFEILKSNSYQLNVPQNLNDISVFKSKDSIVYLRGNGFEIEKNKKIVIKSSPLFSKYTFTIIDRNSESILLGTSEGLYSLQDSTYTYLGDEYPELTTSINSLKNDSFGNTLISAQGEGLGIWYKDTLIFLNEKNGLANNFIEKVEVVDSILWVATNNGLNQLKLNKYGRYDIKHLLGKRFIGFDQIDELLINNGKPVVIHDNQVVFVDPDVLKYPFKNDIVLNKIKVNEISIDSNQTKILEFNYDQNNFYFNYRFNSLHQDENPQFKYRLLGNHDHWISTNQKEVLFTNLPPGTYQFEVKVINPLGKWTPNYSLASFIIHPHFTDTLWFKWTVGVMVFVLLIVTFYLTLINHKLKLKKERILLQTSISSLKRQINPHFIFNAMNSVLYYIAKGDKEDSYKFISQFSKLVRNIVYSTDRKRVPINEELIRINDYMQLEEMRYKDKFTWKIDIEDGLDLEIDSLPPMLIQPIVENSIQHGATQVENGKLLILFRRRHNNLVISVIDNGPGIDISKIEQTDLSQSVGLNNVIQRIKLISNFEKKKNSIEILNNSTFPNSNQKGTEVRITIEQ